MTDFKTETPCCTEANYIIHASRCRNKCQGNDQRPQAWPISESEQQKTGRDCKWRHNTVDNCIPLLCRCTAPVTTVDELSVNMLSTCFVFEKKTPLVFYINVSLIYTYIIKNIYHLPYIHILPPQSGGGRGAGGAGVARTGAGGECRVIAIIYVRIYAHVCVCCVC
jgi:hypothetical protein